MNIIQPVNQGNFSEKVLDASIPTLLEFGAGWCVPCKRLEPILEQLAQQWAGKIQVARLDVDECVDLVTQYQVMSVPTTILFVNGKENQRVTGFQSIDRLIDKFSPYL